MFNISPAPAALAKRASKTLSSATVMFSRWRPPIGFGLSAFIPPWLNATTVSPLQVPTPAPFHGPLGHGIYHILDGTADRAFLRIWRHLRTPMIDRLTTDGATAVVTKSISPLLMHTGHQ